MWCSGKKDKQAVHGCPRKGGRRSFGLEERVGEKGLFPLIQKGECPNFKEGKDDGIKRPELHYEKRRVKKHAGKKVKTRKRKKGGSGKTA